MIRLKRFIALSLVSVSASAALGSEPALAPSLADFPEMAALAATPIDCSLQKEILGLNKSVKDDDYFFSRTTVLLANKIMASEDYANCIRFIDQTKELPTFRRSSLLWRLQQVWGAYYSKGYYKANQASLAERDRGRWLIITVAGMYPPVKSLTASGGIFSWVMSRFYKVFPTVFFTLGFKSDKDGKEVYGIRRPPFLYTQSLLGGKKTTLLETETDRLRSEIISELSSSLLMAGLMRGASLLSNFLKIGAFETFGVSLGIGLAVDKISEEIKTDAAHRQVFLEYKKAINLARTTPSPESKAVIALKGIDQYEALNSFEFLSLVEEFSGDNSSALENAHLDPDLRDQLVLMPVAKEILLLMMLNGVLGGMTESTLQDFQQNRGGCLDSLLQGLGARAKDDALSMIRSLKSDAQVSQLIRSKRGELMQLYSDSMKAPRPFTRGIRNITLPPAGPGGMPVETYVARPVAFGEIFLGTLFSVSKQDFSKTSDIPEFLRNEVSRRVNFYLQVHYWASAGDES